MIIDEPQNMESERSSAAIARLNPFCTLRYSATHKKPYNLCYRLGPIDAYDLNLVKRIEVASVVADDNLNAAYVRLLDVDATKARARIQINHGTGTATKQKKIWVTRGDDLSVASEGRQEYANGFIVDDISFRPGAEAVEFTNGVDVTLSEASGSLDEDVRRAEVAETVRQHLDKERALASHGVKVLSLFFIDKVANYRAFDADGTPSLGPIGQWFEDVYTELAVQPRYSGLDLPPVERAHDGYFSIDNKGVYQDTRGTGEKDSSTYDLIMRDKERLLSDDEPLRFIFSHSALREGLDNPNVFQICTMNETRSNDRKRQEIGRGLRLPVNHDGERIHDPKPTASPSSPTRPARTSLEHSRPSTRRTPGSGSVSFQGKPSPSSYSRPRQGSHRVLRSARTCRPMCGTTFRLGATSPRTGWCFRSSIRQATTSSSQFRRASNRCARRSSTLSRGSSSLTG